MAQPRGDDPRSRTGNDRAKAPGPGPWPRGTPRPAAGRPRLWGSRPGRLGVFTVIAGAVLGALLTIASGSEPGELLGAFVVVATAVAVFAVAPRAAYMVIPVPALAYVVAAVAAGLISDSALDTSRAALAISAVQWIASGFLAMIAATALAIVAAAGRWLAAERRASRALARRVLAGRRAAVASPRPAPPGSATATGSEQSVGQRARGSPPTSLGPPG